MHTVFGSVPAMKAMVTVSANAAVPTPAATICFLVFLAIAIG
jgi:hypothetical protein